MFIYIVLHVFNIKLTYFAQKFKIFILDGTCDAKLNSN